MFWFVFTVFTYIKWERTIDPSPNESFVCCNSKNLSNRVISDMVMGIVVVVTHFRA